MMMLPFLNDYAAGWGLTALAVVMGAIDGFNVCSIGALILVISLVLVFESRRLILLAGFIFLLMTVLTYGALVLFWHRIFFYLLPYQSVFSILIGLIALGGGVYFLKIFIDALRYGPTCLSQNSAVLNWTVGKLERYLSRRSWWAIIIGASLFAVVVTIVEFPCSAAIPLVFVGILSESGVPFGLVLFYIAAYLLFYLLDEIVVFLVAVWAKKIWLGSPKMVTAVSLIGALILFVVSAKYLWPLVAFL